MLCQVLKGVRRIFSKMQPQSWQKNIFLRRGGIAGRKALWKCLVSEGRQKPPPRPIYQRKPKRPGKFVVWIAAKVGRNRFCGTEGIDGSPDSGKRQFFRASFYHSTKIRVFAHFTPAGNLLGSAFPKPCYAPCRARKEVTDHAKEIQYAPPPSCGKDPHDR